MEIISSKNILYTASIPIKQSINLRDKWSDYLTEFIYTCLKDKQISFLSYYPPDKSIGAMFCSDNQKIETFDSIQYYYFSSQLSITDIEQLVKDEEFFLGHIIIIEGVCNPDEINMLSLYRDSELILSDQHIFKMGNDGNSFFCYNMKVENFELEFYNFIEKVKLL